MKNSTAELRRALKASLRLQSLYARSLNDLTGSHHATYASTDEWLAALRELDERMRLHGRQSTDAVSE